MFFYNSSWVASILQACFEITHVFVGKSSLSFGDESRRLKTAIIHIEEIKKKTFSFKMTTFSVNVRRVIFRSDFKHTIDDRQSHF